MTVSTLVVLLLLGLRATVSAQPSALLAPAEIYVDGFHDLRGVAVDAQGQVFVADRSAGTLTLVTPDRGVTILASGLEHPTGVALDIGGRPLVAEERAGRVTRIEPGGTKIAVLSNVWQPRWLAVVADGTIFAAARGLAQGNSVLPYEESAEPELILALHPGRKGILFADGFRGIQGLSGADDILAAATRGRQAENPVDGAVYRIPILPDGTSGPPGTHGPSDALKKPLGLAHDRLRALWVTTSELGLEQNKSKRAIVKLHASGLLTPFADNLDNPAGLAFDSHGNLYVADGSSVIRFVAPDAPILTSPSVTRDTTFPLTGITVPGARVDIFTRGESSAIGTVTARSDGSFSALTELRPGTTSEFLVFSTTHDGHGLTSPPAETTVTHDAEAPSLGFVTPFDGAHVRRAVAVEARAVDTASLLTHITLLVDGHPLDASTTPTPPAPSLAATSLWETSGFVDGAHTLGATAADQAGNTTAISRVIVVDNTPPDTEIEDAENLNDDVLTDTVPVAFSGTDNLTPPASLRYAWRLDAGAWSVLTTATTAHLSGLSPGLHTLQVKAVDLAGNEDPTPATLQFSVHLGPTVTAVTPDVAPVGTHVTIAGVNFQPDVTITFNGVEAVVRSVSPSEITTTVPPGALSGPLTVTTSRGTSTHPFEVALTSDFYLAAAPTLPSAARVPAGHQTSVSISAGGTGGFTSLITLSLSPVANPGLTANFTPAQHLAPGATMSVTLAVASTVVPSRYDFTVIGRAEIDGQTVIRTAPFSLEVLPRDTPAVIGRVLTAASRPEPLVGATITLGTAFTLTDAAGNFLLLSPPSGTHMLLVDGRTASTPAAQYPAIEVRVDIDSSGTTHLPFALYLPELDTTHPVSLPIDASGFTTAEVQATTPLIPGLVVTVPRGSRIIDVHGNPVSQLTITPVPVDRTPMPFPPSMTPPILFTIQPGGAVPSEPLPMTFPNLRNAPPGSRADLYFFDLASGDWAIWGTGTVSGDGTQITSDAGVGLPRLAWHTYCDESCQAPLPDEAPPAENQPALTAGEPVDLFTGRFVVNKTDLLLPARIPIRIVRTYWSGLSRSGLFGPGWNLGVYDSRLASRGDSLSLIQPDQSQLPFAPDGLGRWTNRSSPAFQGAMITRLPGDFSFQLRDKDGTIRRFDRISGFANIAALTSITDRNGNAVTITREGAGPSSFGRITAITEPAGRSLHLSYDSQGRIVAASDPLKRVVRYVYDPAGRLETVTDPAGGITRYWYDAAGNIISVSDPRGITFLTNDYDQAGRVTRQTQADGGVWSFEYLLSGHSVTQTVVRDPLQHPTTYRFNSFGFPLSATDALGQTTVFAYSPGANLLTAIMDPLGRVTRLEYDGRGALTRLTDATGNDTTFSYDNLLGGLVRVTGPLGSTTRLERDSRGNITAVVDATGASTAIVYDPVGQPLSVTDPLGHTTTYAYDPPGNPVTITDPLGNVTRLRYDAVSRLIATTDARLRTTTFTYDALNRLISFRGAGGVAAHASYDGNGNVVSLTDPANRTTTYAHDPMDRLVSRTHPGGETEHFTYDGAGRLAQHTDPAGSSVTYRYDALGRRREAIFSDGGITRWTYDIHGRLVDIADSAGDRLQYAYDLADRLIAHTTRLGTVAYSYDALDRRTRVDTPGVSPITYEWDETSRLVRVRQDTRVAELHYDAAGRRTRLDLPNGVWTHYQYNGASQLNEISYHTPTRTLGTLTYDFDPLGHVTRVGGTLARALLPSAISSATYDNRDRQLTFGTTTLTYNANGYPTAIVEPSGVTTFQWDGRNRLVRLVSPSRAASFRYDGLGRRIAKTIDDISTDFLYDGPDVAQEIAHGRVISYLRLPFVDSPVARGETDYYLADRLGSILALTDSTGDLTTRYVFDPFGLTAEEGAPSDNPLRFVAREDDGTGLVYSRARYYAPELHRFLGPDLLPSLGVNRYAYVANNPMNAIDPFGLETILVNGGAPWFGPGGSSAGATPVNHGLSQIAARLARRGERIVAIFNSGQGETALLEACGIKRGGRPLFLVGHSLGGRVALNVARRLVAECGMSPDHVFTIDPFEAPDVKVPSGIPVTNFYQRRSWWFQAPEIVGAAANILVPGAFHLDITEHAVVKDTIEQTIFESRNLGEPLGGRY